MYQTSAFPLRTVVGPAIPLDRGAGVRILDESPDARAIGMSYQFPMHGMPATVQLPAYAEYLTVFEQSSGVDRLPGQGMATFPLPSDRPFRGEETVLSLFALSEQPKNANIARKLSVRLSIPLSAPALVGGIVFSGLPFLPSDIERTGENASNYGLPREIRVVCIAANQDRHDSSAAWEFLDSEISTTRQEIVSHSGFQSILIDPTYTGRVILHLSDYPSFLPRSVVPTHGHSRDDETLHWGFVIPHFYVFAYEEGARYRPTVSGGVLGAVATAEGGAPARAEHRAVVSAADGDRYVEFTAASAFGTQRTYQVGGAQFEECFVSPPVSPRGTVTLYLQQAEEHERCIAGLKIFLPFVPKSSLAEDLARAEALLGGYLGVPVNLASLANVPRAVLETAIRETVLRIPNDINFCESVGIRVFELDPVDGVSPTQVPLDSKHATLLAEQTVDELSEIVLALVARGIRFTRPSNARYFALQLTNLDDAPGQLVVKRLEFVQSAHVSIHPRASRAQQVRALHFRIIGPGLADDYARLGAQGFSFAVEQLSGGEPKQVLFKARSLLDLLSSGTAKIMANGRRRAIEQETVTVAGGASENFERRLAETRAAGWRRSETGDGVEGTNQWTSEAWLGDAAGGDYSARNSQEIRTHTEVLSPQQQVNEWKAVAVMGNALYAIFQAGSTASAVLENMRTAQPLLVGENMTLVPTYDVVKLYDGFDSVWKGIASELATSRLVVKGMKSVTASPFGYNELGKEVFDLWDAILTMKLGNVLGDGNLGNVLINGADLFGPLTGLFANWVTNPFHLAAANSLGLGLNLQPAGLGVSFSGSTSGGLLTPSYTYVNTFGTQGSIALQAARTGSAYSQFLNTSFDELDSQSRTTAGRSNRIVARSEVAGSDERVKGAEVMWQGDVMDIVTGSIPLNLTLPATAGRKHYGTADLAVRVRFGGGLSASETVDFWFDLVEEAVRDDY